MLKEKLNYFKATSIILDKATKNPNAINVVSSFGLYMFANWASLAKPLIKKAGQQPSTNTDWVDDFIEEINNTMGEFQSTIQSGQSEYIDYLYKYFKNQFIKKNKIELVKKADEVDPPDLPEVSPILWLEMDTEAVVGVERIVSQSSGRFYNNSVQQVVADSVKQNIFERNLPLSQAISAMQRDLVKALKLKPGTLESEIVPTGFRGTAENYFAGLADFTASMARTSGDLITLNEIDAQKIVVRSVASTRTCVGCLQMDGTTYTVPSAVEHMNNKLAVDDVDELKKVQPFFHFKAPKDYSEESLKVAQSLAKELTSDVTLLPPFHFRCECFIDMI